MLEDHASPENFRRIIEKDGGKIRFAPARKPKSEFHERVKRSYGSRL